MEKITCKNCGAPVITVNRTETYIGNIPAILFDKIDNIPISAINGFYICSPYLTDIKFGQSFMEILGTTLPIGKLQVITQSESEWTGDQWRQVRFLKESCRANISTIDNLHAKLYILDAADQSFALITSMNFTLGARSNVELGVFTSDATIFNQQWTVYQHELKPISQQWNYKV